MPTTLQTVPSPDLATMAVTVGHLSAKPATLIHPQRRLALGLGELWPYRELLYFLTWREVKVRYKQTALGAAWAVCQPLITMAIFAIVFGRFARLPSDGLPYALFVLAALVPWTYVAQAIARMGTSIVGDANLIRKIYFPRLALPVASVISPMVDAALALLTLLGLMAWYRVTPTWALMALPFFFGVAILTALSVGLWLSALNVRYRDVGHAIPFLVQIWMYASPIAYSVSLVPDRWRPLYSLNPMVGVVEGFRWSLLGRGQLDLVTLGVSAAGTIVLLVGGLMFFNRMERTFADVA